jgi:hypothetical protein
MFWKKSKKLFVYFTKTGKRLSGNELKMIQYVQTIWIEVAGPLLETTNIFGRLNNISAQDRNLTKTF